MSQTADVGRQVVFMKDDLVIWHHTNGNRCIPVPAVVVREESDGVIIRARIEGTCQMLHVDAEELVAR
jgi:hypothetical protein